MDRLKTEMETEQGLALTWFDVLLQLSFAPKGELRMSELLHNLMLTRSGLTRRIDRMEAAGLVARLESDEDRRGVIVALTRAGRTRLRAAAPPHLARITQYFAQHFTDEEAHAASSAFGKVLAGLEPMPADDCAVAG